MKIAILGDTHFGMRGDSLPFHNLYRKFYSEVFFPYLDQNGITTIFQLGDLFDRRKFISFQSLALSRKYFFDPMKGMGISFHTLVGNHDIAFKNTLEVNSPTLLLNDYDNITIWTEPGTVSFGTDIDVIPWICQDNESQVNEFIKNSKADICFGHFEIAGFEMDRGNVCHEGMDADALKRYEIALSGHFHHKSDNGHIFYVGTPGEMTWSDYNDERGFHIFDTNTRTLEFIPNPHRMFYKINYNDDGLVYQDISEADYSQYAGKYVKIVVEKKSNAFLFDTLIDCLSKVNPLDVSIVEDFSDLSGENNDVNIDEAEDTITILNKYIDGLTLPVESDIIKGIMRDVYSEALTLET
jgi:DNA repair exonuclease SbcCD nuclease subunit